MMVTVQDMMKLDIIKHQLTLLGGEKGLHKAVNYITIMEAPDFYKWVSGGEFVLTSWYAYSQDPTGQEEAFTALAKHVSCIGIKVNRFLDFVPPVLIKLANEHEVPLFAIEHDTKFREIIQAVSNELQNFQTNILIKVEKHYNELMQAALASDNFSSVLRTTAQHIGKSCHCFNAEGKYLGGFIAHKDTDRKRRLDVRDFYKEYLENRPEEYNHARHIKIDGYYVFTCVARKHLLGFFIIESDEELTEPLLLIAQQTVSVLSLKLLEGYASMQKRLLQLLQEIKKETVTQESLTSFGLTRQAKYFYAACLVSSGHIESIVGASNFLKNTDRLLSLIDEKQVVFIGVTNKGLPNEIPRSLQALQAWISKNKLPVTVAMGTRVTSISDLPGSYSLAHTTANAAMRMGVSGFVESRDWLVPAFLIKQLNSFELRQIEKNVLKPILAYDEANKTELLHTLKVFVNSSKTDTTAAELHIHVNTLRYRLAKIRDLTGYDPANLQQLNVLLLAVMVSDLKKK